jgi:hypothetical protein
MFHKHQYLRPDCHWLQDLRWGMATHSSIIQLDTPVSNQIIGTEAWFSVWSQNRAHYVHPSFEQSAQILLSIPGLPMCKELKISI